MVVTAEMLIYIGIGVFFGYFIGRARAEFGRAQFDTKRVWAQRRFYRE